MANRFLPGATRFRLEMWFGQGGRRDGGDGFASKGEPYRAIGTPAGDLEPD
jgi:hypothetical protein